MTSAAGTTWRKCGHCTACRPGRASAVEASDGGCYQAYMRALRSVAPAQVGDERWLSPHCAELNMHDECPGTVQAPGGRLDCVCRMAGCVCRERR